MSGIKPSDQISDDAPAFGAIRGIGNGSFGGDRLTGMFGMRLRNLEIRALKPRARIYKRADERGLYRSAPQRV